MVRQVAYTHIHTYIDSLHYCLLLVCAFVLCIYVYYVYRKIRHDFDEFLKKRKMMKKAMSKAGGKESVSLTC